MRFIHTADWHLGNKMYDVDRMPEFENFLEWLKKEIQEKNAETLVVSGDVYDTSNPPLEARKIYNKFLASLLETKCRNIIIVGGNHDSGALLDTEKDILEALNIHVVGSIANQKIEDLIFSLFDVDKNISGICCAIPYARESELRKIFDSAVDDGTFSDKAYEKLYGEAYKIAKGKCGKNKLPIIATGHLYASDLEGRLSDVKGEVKTDDGTRILDVVGKLGSVHAKIFPDFDYVALGHIHYSTMVAKNPKIRYSGSPFVMGFDEANIPHHILCVDVDSENHLEVEKIEVPTIFNYRRISGKSKDIIETLLEYKKNIPTKKTFVEAFYKLEDGINIHDEIEKIVPQLPENVLVVNKKLIANENKEYLDFQSIDMDDLKNFDPKEIFSRLVLSKKSAMLADYSDEEKKAAEEKILEKYVPLFLQTMSEVENGE